jgi:hypothetical protein
VADWATGFYWPIVTLVSQEQAASRHMHYLGQF